ncbi:MAG TPA: HEAT repeat domain-containing protein, partial [Pyrinomonadaceae bacterium]
MPNKIKPLVLIFVLVLSSVAEAQRRGRQMGRQSVPAATLLLITKAEDERRWEDDLRKLLSNASPAVRKRAALAAGRIGNEDSVAPLTDLLEKDTDASVRSMAAFAIGEVESPTGANALVAVLKNTSATPELRGRAIEALGKIAAALPADQEQLRRQLGTAIVTALKQEIGSRSPQNDQTILFGLTAALRARPPEAGPTIAEFLTHLNSRVRSDAANALARLRLKDGNEQLRKLVAADTDPNVRANAARVLGVTEDKQSFDLILSRATTDLDLRVRVNAIRALASLKDPRAAEPLFKRGLELSQRKVTGEGVPAENNEVLEIATTLGRLLAQKEDRAVVEWLQKLSEALNHRAPEVELALVRIAPVTYLAGFGSEDQARRKVQEIILLDWRAASGVAAGLGEVAALPDSVTNKNELAATAQ